ncbi:MAG: NIPSNAP family protein [Cyclobacteriaceae bacterium]|nr:NIPSNAP family protein [Cyclobacteriaceae bacterium]
MKNLLTVFALFLVLSSTYSQEKKEFYQLKKYSLKTEKQEKIVDEYLEKAYLPALHRLGINDIGVFKPIETIADTVRSIYVLIPYSSLDKFSISEKELSKDKTYQKDGKTYLNAAHDNAPYQRIESTLMEAFDNMPIHKVPSHTNKRSERVYELRSYESSTETLGDNKIHMFNDGGEISLFTKLNFNAVFYAKVISGAKMPNLMYITSFTDMESREAHWKAFSASPEWGKLKVMKKYLNNMSGLDSYLLYPTEYSDY